MAIDFRLSRRNTNALRLNGLHCAPPATQPRTLHARNRLTSVEHWRHCRISQSLTLNKTDGFMQISNLRAFFTATFQRAYRHWRQ